MCILAHPDDESYGMGAVLAKYAAEGVQTSLLTATRGQRGWPDPTRPYPGPQELGRLRERELGEAARLLGLQRVDLLEHMDGELDQVPHTVIVSEIVAHLRRERPQVVVTFGPNGTYGHPDHIAISQFCSAAAVVSGSPEYHPELGQPHQVAKLYYMAETKDLMDYFTRLSGDMATLVDGVERRPTPWEAWEVTTQIDATAYAHLGWQAVRSHASQLAPIGHLDEEPLRTHQILWGNRTFYRVFSLVNSGRTIETNLFEGLIDTTP
jgi:LmbE family N-acetylglucosaminyl deacetylase